MKKKPSQRKQSPHRVTEKELMKELYCFVALCYASLEKLSLSEIASKADLSPATVLNLVNRTTRYPRFLTVQKLGIAAGFKLEMHGSRVLMRIAG